MLVLILLFLSIISVPHIWILVKMRLMNSTLAGQPWISHVSTLTGWSRMCLRLISAIFHPIYRWSFRPFVLHLLLVWQEWESVLLTLAECLFTGILLFVVLDIFHRFPETLQGVIMLVSNLLNLVVQRIVLTNNVRKVLKHLSILIVLFIKTTSWLFFTMRRSIHVGSILRMVLTLIVVIVGVKNSIIIEVEIFPFLFIGHFLTF